MNVVYYFNYNINNTVQNIKRINVKIHKLKGLVIREVRVLEKSSIENKKNVDKDIIKETVSEKYLKSNEVIGEMRVLKDILTDSMKAFNTSENVKVAAIMDEFSYECFKYECDLIYLNPFNWEQKLETKKPELLFVESLWEGIDGSWRNKDSTLRRIIRWCKKNNIKTVFWNKEDPVHYKRFIKIAKLCDIVFTTDLHSIKKYKEALKHDNIYVLPFAAQPMIHNPINKEQEKLGRVAFAGSWYSQLHSNREKDMEIVLKPALEYDLSIYDRNAESSNRYFKFPNIYQSYIKGNLEYKDMTQVYKKYHIFLNVNTTQNSYTMFSRRIFELLACGTNVISSYSLGIEDMFSEIVKLCKTQKDTKKYLDMLIGDKYMRDRLSLLGQRKVFFEHTYSHRIEEVFDKANINYKKKEESGVSIITCTNRLNYMDVVFDNYKRQKYTNKELIVILNNNSMNIEIWKKGAEELENVRVFQLDEEKTLGECLNFAVKQAKLGYVSKFDDDNYYGPEFIGDLMNAFKYTEAGVVGKYTYYTYFEKNKRLIIRCPDKEYQYVDFLSGSALIIKKEVFNEIEFPHISCGEDSIFLKECRNKGIKLYSADRFNYACIRHPTLSEHTWKVNEEALAKNSMDLGIVEDYKKIITV
ncbi:glycosyltransferase family protein [Wukongibacter sp. M2B1]|uniref:glycosyltransferase family protein n=1 Tax=Wukongibacter sp. M2B1 TaxID=3088895 RepID=UPI003D7968C5